ncbi:MULTISPECIES: hypothetical protein [unclassified Bradyrhizobium]|nr:MULTISPECIES: hypothetical protein [unclassified Bradyrhizobium]
MRQLPAGAHDQLLHPARFLLTMDERDVGIEETQGLRALKRCLR